MNTLSRYLRYLRTAFHIVYYIWNRCSTKLAHNLRIPPLTVEDLIAFK